MKPVLFALLAMVGYAVGNVIMESKLSKYNNLTVMIGYSAITCLLALVARQVTMTNDPTLRFPTGWPLLWLVIMGLGFFAADYFFIGAYTGGGSLLTITSITVMFPLFASLIKFGLTRTAPNPWQIGGFVLAALAVILVTRGSVTE